MNVLDLFCGCGISLGFKLSGFNIIGGVDIDPDSIKTFQKNFPESKAICENLLDYSDKKIIEDFGKKEISVIVGGPLVKVFPLQTDGKKNKMTEK